jgi:hypothetical protein
LLFDCSATAFLTPDIIDLRRSNRLSVPSTEGQTVFLSSVMGELAEERAAVASRLKSLWFRVRWFEEFGGRDDSAEDAYLSEVRASTVYLGLLANEYGTMLQSAPYAGFSATHAEYLEARRHGKRVSFWVGGSDADRAGHARNFLSEVRLFHVTGSFRSAEELANRVEERLREMAADDLSPWVKLGNVVIRGRRVIARGDTLHIETRVFDHGVLRALQELAGDASTWGRAHEVQVTYDNRSGRGRIEEVAVETRSGAFNDVFAELRLDWANGRGDVMAAGTQGYSADHLTEVSLRVGMLGEPMPAALQSMAFMVEPDDPLAPLEDLGIPEGSVQALARLLVTEHLLASGRASSIQSFALGPDVRGSRQLELSWREPQRYVNQTPQVRSISGARRSR